MRSSQQSSAKSLKLSTIRYLLLGFFLLLTGSSGVVAQEQTQEPPQPIVVTGTLPSQITAGQSAILIVTGANFRSTTTIALVGVGNLSVTLVSPTELRAAIPSNLAAGQYIIQVSDPQGGSSASFTLTVLSPTQPPLPTDIPILPTIAPPPTDVPGQPSLLVRSFTANPQTIKPGESVTFTIDVINQGNRLAQGISVSVDTGGKFVAANGQATIILPDLLPGATNTFRLAVLAASDTPGGPQPVNITFNYRDFTGQTYSSKGTPTVNVETVQLSSQVTLSRYLVDPNPVVPGEPVKITVLLTNTGNETAAQVLVTASNDGVLLAGPQGNSFPLGDIEPGLSASVEMPLIVSGAAKAGPQNQNISITFLQKGETKNVIQNMTLTVARVDAPAPVMVIQSYDFGDQDLQPGAEFTLELQLLNIGNDNAKGLTVTFGSVESTGGGTEPTPGSSASTTTTTSNNFAPLETAGQQVVGDVPAGNEAITVRQKFIVNGSVDSGVYPLPVTLRYQRSDGSFSQDNLRVSIPVIVPPQIRITQSSPLPAEANMGEPLFMTLEIANRGRKPVNFSNAVISVEGGEVISEAETFLGPLRNEDQTTLEASVLPNLEGEMTIIVTLNYTDDLNRVQSLTQEYTVNVLPPLPTPDIGELPEGFNPFPVEQEDPQLNGEELLGRLLLGLLGLGS
jgi:hypothetical protein